MNSPKRPQKAVTIADIAITAGVATSTVSRALSNSELVSESTRKQIEEIAAQLNYRHPFLGESIRSRTKNIALVVPDISNPYFASLIRGAHIGIASAGFTQILIDTEESPQTELESILKFSNSVDGMILAASRLSDEELLEISAEKPVVALNRSVKGLTSVQIDTAGGSAQAVEHLVSMGHRRIVYISGPASSWSNEKRWQAIKATSERLGVEVTKTSPFLPTFLSGPAAADAAAISGASAAICFNDPLAIGVMQRLASRGKRVPEDFSVVGCDDSYGSDFCNPPLTTISSPNEKAGRAAVKTLLSMIQEDAAPGKVVQLETYLKLRNSTAEWSGDSQR